MENQSKKSLASSAMTNFVTQTSTEEANLTFPLQTSISRPKISISRKNNIQNIRSQLKVNLFSSGEVDNKNNLQIKIIPQNNELDNLTQQHEKADRLDNIYYIQGNFNDYYEEQDVLGEGCVGLVKKVIKVKNRKQYAVKIVKTRDEETIHNIRQEFINLKKLDHPNIVKVYELYIDKRKGKIYTIMELVEAKELFEVINDVMADNGHFTEENARTIFAQILNAIKYMHAHGVCHRDLKPNNILAKEDGSQLKITDFNVSKFNNDYKNVNVSNLKSKGPKIKMWTYTGTIAFSAPEIFGDSEYTEQVDMWSSGVILYTMLGGQQPFASEYVEDLIQIIRKGVFSMQGEVWDHVSSDAKDLIQRCLTVDANERITPEEALNHQWIIKKRAQKPLPSALIDNHLMNRRRLIKKESRLIQSEFQLSRRMTYEPYIFGEKQPFNILEYHLDNAQLIDPAESGEIPIQRSPKPQHKVQQEIIYDRVEVELPERRTNSCLEININFQKNYSSPNPQVVGIGSQDTIPEEDKLNHDEQLKGFNNEIVGFSNKLQKQSYEIRDIQEVSENLEQNSTSTSSPGIDSQKHKQKQNNRNIAAMNVNFMLPEKQLSQENRKFINNL